MEAKQLLGTCKVNITPKSPVPLAGFASRSGMDPASDISHSLYARIFAFESMSSGEGIRGDKKIPGPHKVLLISADLLWWGSDQVPGLKRKIRTRFGIEETAVLLHGTHTHSGPQTSQLFTSYIGLADAAYLVELEELLMEGIEQALANLEPVRAERAAGSSALGINRRGLRKSPPEMEKVDHELTVIRFVKQTGIPKAILVHYACHPVITNENKISSEFTGVAMETIEDRIGEGLIAGYLQGTCGDINPGDGSSLIRGTDQQVMEVAHAFAADIMRTLDKPMTPLKGCRLQWWNRTIDLPLSQLPTMEALESGSLLPDVHGEWNRIQLERWKDLQTAMPLEMTIVKFAEECFFLTMNAEIVIEYGLYIKQRSGGRCLPVAYTNGMFGYVPTAAQLKEKGYETHESTIYFAMPSIFDSSVENVMKKGIDVILSEALASEDETNFNQAGSESR